MVSGNVTDNKVKWSANTTRMLIDHYKVNSFLWDQNHKKYGNKGETKNLQILYTLVLRLPLEIHRKFGHFVVSIIQKYTKFASVYFPCFTIFRHQTWQFY